MRTETVAVIGDWVVDEHWRVQHHESAFTRQTGIRHFRSSAPRGQAYLDLCGAGHLLRCLVELGQKLGLGEAWLSGVGSWHVEDDNLMRHLIHRFVNGNYDKALANRCSASLAEFRITPGNCGTVPGVQLVNLRWPHGTTRIVRFYEDLSTGLSQRSRIDWEVPPDSDDDRAKSLERVREELPQDCQWVVVHDLARGVVSRDLATAIHERNPEAKWWIRTKSEENDWLPKGADVRGEFIGPERLRDKNPWGEWFHEDHLHPQALEHLPERRAPLTILCFNEREVLIATPSGRLLPISFKQPLHAVDEVAWPSAMFASSFLHLGFLGRDVETDDAVLGLIASDADEVRFSSGVVDRRKPPHRPYIRLTPIDEEEESGYRVQAQEELGLLNVGDELQLQFWRGCSALRGFVACVPERQVALQRLGSALRSFRNARDVPPLGILVSADPGSGKTYLAQRLADVLEFAFLRTDISQMISRSQLTDLFDMVSTRQAEERRKVLVFVDEVNQTLEGEHVYGSFLSVLEDSVYLRGMISVHIRPCAWLFAETRQKSAGGQSRKGSSADDVPLKKPDFMSRLRLNVGLDIASLFEQRRLRTRGADIQLAKKKLSQEISLERVYLAAAMMRKYFPEVKQVDRSVLEFFHQLPDQTSARQIRNLVFALRDVVQHGRITVENCSVAWAGSIDPTLEALAKERFAKLKPGKDEGVTLVF